LLDCSVQCTDPNLKNISSNAGKSINLTSYWLTFYDLLGSTLEPYNDANIRNTLRSINCDVNNPVGQSLTGSGLLLGGLVICVVLCLILRGRKDTVEDTK